MRKIGARPSGSCQRWTEDPDVRGAARVAGAQPAARTDPDGTLQRGAGELLRQAELAFRSGAAQLDVVVQVAGRNGYSRAIALLGPVATMRCERGPAAAFRIHSGDPGYRVALVTLGFARAVEIARAEHEPGAEQLVAKRQGRNHPVAVLFLRAGGGRTFEALDHLQAAHRTRGLARVDGGRQHEVWASRASGRLLLLRACVAQSQPPRRSRGAARNRQSLTCRVATSL